MSAHSSGPPPLAARLIMWVFRIVTVALASIVVASVVTRIAWELQPRHNLEVFVFDQTVANDRYSEHAILGQLFDYHKVDYDYTEDYYGRSPDGDPHGTWPAGPPDIAILADAYGVYATTDIGPELVSDYLTLAQAREIASWVEGGTPTYAEFSMVYNPTPGSAGSVIEDTFGFTSSKWVFRQWDNLTEVSPNIKALHDGAWEFEGPGIVFVAGSAAGRTVEEQIVVLTEDDLDENIPRVVGGAPGSIRGTALFDGWAGVIEARAGTTVDAEFEIRVNDEGAAKLAAEGIPSTFPALVRQNNTIYFAGNGLADDTPFRLRHLYGASTFTRLITGQEFRFFYTVLEPTVGWLLDQTE